LEFDMNHLFRASVDLLLPILRRVPTRQRASIISEEAVMIGVIATLGLGAAVAFMTGLGSVFQRALALIAGQV
jgi:hypothetical protein